MERYQKLDKPKMSPTGEWKKSLKRREIGWKNWQRENTGTQVTS